MKNRFVLVSLVMITSALAAVPSVALSSPAKAGAKWEDCWEAREGLGRAVDFNAAYACSLAEVAWTEVAVMRMNGQGTARDLKGAREALAKLPAPQEVESAERAELMAAIVAREASKAPLPALRFCEDIAWSSFTFWNRCEEARTRRETEAEKRFVSEAKAALVPAANTAFKKVWLVYPKFRAAEGDRIYQSCDGGSSAEGAGRTQEALVRDHFAAHHRALVVGALQLPAPKRSFAEADNELNVVYVANVRGGGSAGYAAKAKMAQRLWLKYRDAWGNVVAAQHTDPAQRPQAREFAKALLTESRIVELRNDPLHVQ